MAHVEQRDGRGSNKRRLLWVILLVGIATLGIFRWHTYRRLMQRIEALRTQGYPTSAAELDDWYRESAPNDVGQGWDAYADAFWDYVEWSDQETENLPGYGRDLKFQRGQSWEPVHLQKAEAFLTENKVCLDLLHKAAERGPILAPFDLSEGRDLWLREVREVRQCAKLLQLASRTAARHKDGEGSIMAIRTMLSLVYRPQSHGQ